MPTKKEIIKILKTSIANYTKLNSNGLETTNVETQVLRLAILYLKGEENNQLLQKFWNAFYKEEDEWEKLFVGTSNHEKWFTSYRPWLQVGFEIATKVLSQEIEK